MVSDLDGNMKETVQVTGDPTTSDGRREPDKNNGKSLCIVLMI